MVRDSLRTIPEGLVDVTAPVRIDGLSYVEPDDPAMPMYRVIANNRQPVALRDLMIAPVRSGYIGDGRQPDPALVPPIGRRGGARRRRGPGLSTGTRRGGPLPALPAHAPRGTGALPVIVYYHGGGFTVGSSEDCDFLARKLAFTNEALVVSANYRSAPEFMFPVPLDDAFAVYRWVVEHGAQLDADPARVVVAGDSAGSNFAAAIPLRAREEGVRVPDAVVMLGAFADFQFERWPSFLAAGAPRDRLRHGVRRVHPRRLRRSAAWDHPWVSPIEGDLTEYPLAVVVAGTHDPIVDSARAFARRIREAGGRTVDYFPEGMPHGFYFFPGVHPEEDIAYGVVAERSARSPRTLTCRQSTSRSTRCAPRSCCWARA